MFRYALGISWLRGAALAAVLAASACGRGAPPPAANAPAPAAGVDRSALGMFAPLPAAAQNLVPRSASSEVEDALGGMFKAIEANKLDDAYGRVEALIASRPHYRLAYLLKGDLLLARAYPIHGMGAMPGGKGCVTVRDNTEA